MGEEGLSPTAPRGGAPKASGIQPVFSDIAAGLGAIVFVVGTSIRASFVASDLRVLFAVSAVAFFGAGLLRGGAGRARVGPGRTNPWLQGLVVSTPGLLGTGALIMNDGLHRLPIPIGISLLSIAFAIAGVQTRRWWHESRTPSLALAAASALALIVGVPIGVPRLAVLASTKHVDFILPAFTLAAFDGGPIRSAELRGRVVVLAFWASWCLPCRWELPEVDAVSSRFAGDSLVRFIAAEVNWGGETPARGIEFLARHGLSLPAAFDSGGASRSLHVHALPTVVLAGRDGRVRMVHYGYDKSERFGDELERVVRALRVGTHAPSP